MNLSTEKHAASGAAARRAVFSIVVAFAVFTAQAPAARESLSTLRSDVDQNTVSIDETRNELCRIAREAGAVPPPWCENPACAAAGGVEVAGGCWIAFDAATSGNAACGRPAGYAGPYYSINGLVSADGCTVEPCPAVAGTASLEQALNITTALGLTPSSTFCGSGSYPLCDADCATNVNSESGGAWGTRLTCFNNVQRWNRGFGIVRCTNLE